MILYLDTSSLLKLYINEPYSDLVHGWAQQVEVLCSSRIAYTEAIAGMSRRWRQGDLDDVGFQRFRRTFSDEWQGFAVVNVNEILAADLAMRHGLRGFDAIHLAAAVEVLREVASVPVFFSSFDVQLSRAAADHLTILDQDADAGLPPTA